MSTARVKLNALVASGALTEPRVNTVMRLLESDPTTLFPYEQERRDRFKRYLKGELDLFDAFGHIPAEPPAADRPVMRPEPSAPLGRIRAGGSREGASGSGEPGKPKSLSRSVTLFGSAVLGVTVLFISLGVVFTEKAGQFLHQALPNVSISGGMPAATPSKSPGVPAAAPAKTPAGPEVIEVQRGPAGSDKPEVLAAAEPADEAARAKAAADIAAKDAAAARPIRTLAKVESAKLVPDDIRQALYHRGHALLIGVADYTTGWDKLPDVKNDLNDLKEGLAPHFETVETVLSPTVAEIRTKMRDFLLGQWNKPNERLFIYYSGVGFTAWNDASRQASL